MSPRTFLSWKKKLAPMIAAAGLFLFAFGSSAWADTAGPAVSNISPAANAVLSTNKITMKFSLADPDEINPASLQLTINGVSFPVTAAYPEIGHYVTVEDSCGGGSYNVWVVDGHDYKSANVTADVSDLPDNNTAVITVADKLGNVTTTQWDFRTNVPPSYSNMTPAANWSANALPLISAAIKDKGGVNEGSIVLKVNGSEVLYNFNPATGVVSYTPAIPLAPGWYTVTLQSMDIAENFSNTSWSFGIAGGVGGSGPVFSEVTPSDGSTVAPYAQTISFTATDADKIQGSSIEVKVNNVIRPFNVTYQQIGHYQTLYDSCGGGSYNVWVVDGYDYTKAVVTARVVDLPDDNTVNVIVADQKGNASAINWTFKTPQAPVISGFVPANGSNALSNKPYISADISDNGTIDTGSIVMKLSGAPVKFTYTSSSQRVGKVVYQVPETLPAGTYNVELTVKDTAGIAQSASWNFTVIAGTAAFSNFTPGEGTLVSVTNPTVTVRAVDSVAFNQNSAVMVVNGKTVTPQVTYDEVGYYATFYDSCTGNPYQQWVRTGWDYSKATLTYSASQLTDGVIPVTANITNTNGGTSSGSWSFSVGVPPVIGQVVPSGAYTADRKQVISAVATDNTQITGATMLLNGAQVPVVIDTVNNIVYHQPVDNLLYDTLYTVKLEVNDAMGAKASKTWQFSVQTYPNWSSTSGNCADCHIGYPSPNHPMTNCGGCHEGGGFHGAGKPISECQDCHGYYLHSPDYIAWYPCNYCHNSTYAYKIPSHPADVEGLHVNTALSADCQTCHRASLTEEHARHTIPGTTRNYTCSTCHWVGTTQRAKTAVVNNDVRCEACHDIHQDIAVVHTSQFVDPQPTDCSRCHNSRLDTEHAGRISDSGQPINCNTCHNSTDPKTIEAVVSGNTSCSACHDNFNHVIQHDTQNLDKNCTTCHLNNLYDEHLANPKTQSRSLNCATCHNATIESNPAVYNSIAYGNNQCAGCHSSAHGFGIAEKINADITLYDGLTWSSPVDASIWAGEVWASGESVPGGKIVLSSRSSDINGDNVFQFYKNDLTGKGWTLATPVPEAGTTFFTAVFGKDEHKAVLMFDNREYHSTDSAAVPSGYRITILYN